jgi:hypothetical protein
LLTWILQLTPVVVAITTPERGRVELRLLDAQSQRDGAPNIFRGGVATPRLHAAGKGMYTR